MACTWLIVEQVTIESIGDPPQIVVGSRRPLPERHRETDDEGKIVYEMSDSVVVVVAFQEL